MNVTLTIQDCSLQELQTLFARLAAVPATAPVATTPATPALPAFASEPEPRPEPRPEPELTPEPAAPARRGRPAKAKTTREQMLAERQAAQEREEKALAETMVVGENGIREPLGKALERLQAEKRFVPDASKPVVGRHDDGDVLYWRSATEAARAIGVSIHTISAAARECRKVRGWMLEYDEQKKGGAA